MTEAPDEVIDDVTDVTEDNDTTDSSEPTIDDYNREKARREKAEKTLVEQKRKLKELEAKGSEPGEFVTKADLAIEKFTDKNPELADYTEELKAYQKKGLSLDEAKTLILNSDKARVNREKVNSLGLSDGETSSKKSSYSMKDLEKLASSNPTEYSRVLGEMDAGKIKLDR